MLCGEVKNLLQVDLGLSAQCENRSPGPLGLIPAALSIPWSSKIRRVTQTLTREPLFTRCCDIFTEQPPGVCGRSISDDLQRDRTRMLESWMLDFRVERART